MTATIHPLPVTQPHPIPYPGSIAIAEGILSAGYGPEKIPWVVAGFREAGALSREIATAMATLEGASSLEEYLSSAGCAAVLSASGPS